MGKIILMNVFLNYIVAMPLIIITIYNRWSFGRYFKSLIFFLFFLNALFWIIYLLYRTFIFEPREKEKERLEALRKEELEQEKDNIENGQNVNIEVGPEEDELNILRGSEENESEIQANSILSSEENDMNEKITNEEINNDERYLDLDTSQ